MASRLNCPPDNTQLSAVNAIIARQESLVTHLQGIHKEEEREYMRLIAKAAVLQRSAVATDTFSDIGTQIRDRFSPALIKLDQLLLSQDADHAVLSSLLPSTKTILTDWTAVRHALAALLSTLEEPVKKIEGCIVSIADELHNTEVLRGQMSDATTTLSEMIKCGLQSIQAKKVGILHPLRRVPDEIMLQIFGECIEEERDSLREMLPLTETPCLPSILAAVCRRWRQIVLHTPHFWNFVSAPLSSWSRTRLGGWEKIVSFAKDASLEMTVPLQSKITPEFSTLRLHRLNIVLPNVDKLWPIDLPSPDHLWIGRSDPAHSSRHIPPKLISSTVFLTCVNFFPRFLVNNHSIRTVSIKGDQSSQFFGLMLIKLRQLQKADMTQLRLDLLVTAFDMDLTHHFLSHLAIHASALPAIDYYLRQGLRFPALRRFAVEDVEGDGYSASNYTSIASQFKPTVTALEISGTSHGNAVLSWIEALLPLEELVASGEDVTLVTLGLLYQSSDAGTDPQGAIRLPPKGLTSLVIRQYMHDGTLIHQQLKHIHRNPHPESQPIKVIFERCPNILPSIRSELSGELENTFS